MNPPHDLKALRVSRGLRQDQLASRKQVIDLEKGRIMPGIRSVRKMARILRVSEEIVWQACAESCRLAQAAQESPLGSPNAPQTTLPGTSDLASGAA